MRKLLTVLIGLVLLVAAAATLWIARGPQAKAQQITGGVLYTQQEIAMQIAQTGQTALETVVDVPGGLNTVPLQPALSQMAIGNLETVEGGVIEAAPPTIAQMEAVPQGALAYTTDLVLSEDVVVMVAPIATGGAAQTGSGGAAGTAQGYEQRVVELEWPRAFQVGRSGAVRITLKMLSGGALQPVAEVAGNEILATPILITDRYATHDAFVTATIAAPDFTVNAVTPLTQQLFPGQDVTWRWTLEADSAQKAVIALGLTISWQPKPGNPLGPQNVPIWGQALQTEVNYVFGLISVPQASWLGTALGVLGFIAQYPLLEKLLEIGLDILFGRARRQRERSRTSSRNRSDDRRRR